MASYGRNFGFRASPRGGERSGRFASPGTGNKLPIGAPVVADTTASETALGLRPVTLATGAQAPRTGQTGILVFEYAPAAFAGVDPFLTTWSDLDTVPLGAAVQVVNGLDVKVWFHNTQARTFLNTRQYAARTMVAGLTQATPAVAVGNLLTPGTGSDAAGYWAVTATASDAWMVVTKVDTARNEVEARLLF